MGGSAPSVPTYDPYQVAQTQQGYNTSSAVSSQLMSEVGQQTPFGSLSYNQTGSYTDPSTGQTIPLTTATTQLSPQEQSLLNTSQGTQQTAATGAGQVLAGANYGGTNPTEAIGSMTSGLTGQMLGADIASVQPYFNQQTEMQQSQLANQGLTPGTPGYDNAMRNLYAGQNQSIMGFLGQAQPTAFSEAQNLYNQPLQTAESLYSIGSPASLSTNLINTPTQQVQPTNLTGAVSAANQANIANAQLQEQQYGSTLGGIAGLGSALIGKLALSDRTAKTEIEPIGSLFDETPVYLYEYKHDPGRKHIGLMAQDVKEFAPEAVTPKLADGYHRVDYAKATERARSLFDHDAPMRKAA